MTPSREIAHAGKKKVLRTFLFHHLELTRKEFRVSEIINHMLAFHVVAGIAICTPHCAANDDIHVLNLTVKFFLFSKISNPTPSEQFSTTGEDSG